MGYFRMKYEQFMMRFFDWVLEVMDKNPNLAWYPRHILCQDLEDKIQDLERENNHIYCHLIEEERRANRYFDALEKSGY